MWEQIRYYIDPESDLPHIFDHDVSEDEVEDVLRHPAENRSGGENTRVLIGRTRAGRVLKVICVPDEDELGVFVITAYYLTGKALSAFRRRERRR